MLRHIVKKEIQDTIISPKFVFTFLLCTILVLLSVYVGINNYSAEKKEYDSAIELNKRYMESQQDYGALSLFGTRVTKPPQVLSAIITGVQDAVGRTATINSFNDPKLVDSKYDSNPVFAIFGPLDLTLIVKIVLSLFAILFTFDAISGEKERGTLKLTLSNRVPRDKLILGKTIGNFVSLLVPLLIPFIIGLIMLVIYPEISLTGGDWARIGLIFLFFLLYLSVFFTLGLFVSSRTSRSSSSLFILLFLWVIFIFVIPKAAVIAASHIKPVQSVHRLNYEKDSNLLDLNNKIRQGIGEWYNEHKSEENDPMFVRMLLNAIEEMNQKFKSDSDKKNEKLVKDYQLKRHKQQMLALNLSRISPASSMTFGALSLGKTGLNEHEKFLNKVKEYKPQFSEWVDRKNMDNMRDMAGKSLAERMEI